MGVYLWVETGPLCFTANTASSTVTLGKTGTPTVVSLETSTDGNTRTTYTIGNTITLSNIGDKVYFRNTSETDTQFSTSGLNYYEFTMAGSISGSGDVTSLLNKNCTNTLSNYCFTCLFDGCSSLTKAPYLPATTLGNRCYYGMFWGAGLVEAPELPATTLTEWCYRAMFSGCTSLTKAPDLPATTLATYCYGDMFNGCTSLTKAPDLPATTLATYCYQSMFYQCTALTTLPKLPATTLADGCYMMMFQNCTNIKLSTTQTGEYQTAYRIPTTGTGTTATNALLVMFGNTGGTFTGTPTINTTYYTSNQVI